MFGVIHPINYALLAAHISENWVSISRHFDQAQRSAFPIKFSSNPNTPGRSFTSISFTKREEMGDIIASSFPYTLSLDINRFYGSIYTHSLPWAILGKDEGQKRHRNGTLDKHWSSETDKLLRACNSNQTIGIPIGPDTSRIASEIILTRVDMELDATLEGKSGDEYFHNIDDYKFGSMSVHECEAIKALFEREIRKFELRSRDDKEMVSDSLTNQNHSWVRDLSIIEPLNGKEFLDALFSIISASRDSYPNANVLGYSLSRYSKRISSFSTRECAISHLQRLLFAAPWAVTSAAPLLIGLKGREALSISQVRLIRYGIQDGLRKHDVVSVLWYLYLYLNFNQKIEPEPCIECIELDSSLVDLMLMHMAQNELIVGVDVSAILAKRHEARAWSSPSWLFLYEAERRGWCSTGSERRIGKSKASKKGEPDPGSFFLFAQKNNVQFYNTSAFGIDYLPGQLSAKDFEPSETERIRFALGLDGKARGNKRKTFESHYSGDKSEPALKRRQDDVRTKTKTLSNLLQRIKEGSSPGLGVGDNYDWEQSYPDDDFSY